MNTNKKVDFANLTKKQSQSKDNAWNTGKVWTAEEIAFLKAHMFDVSLEDLAYSLQRTVYAVETQLGKNPELVEWRKKHGDVPTERSQTKKSEPRNYFEGSDMDTLFGSGD